MGGLFGIIILFFTSIPPQISVVCQPVKSGKAVRRIVNENDEDPQYCSTIIGSFQTIDRQPVCAVIPVTAYTSDPLCLFIGNRMKQEVEVFAGFDLYRNGMVTENAHRAAAQKFQMTIFIQQGTCFPETCHRH